MNMSELKWFSEQEWAKPPPGHCEGLIHSFRKLLLGDVAAKGGAARY